MLVKVELTARADECWKGVDTLLKIMSTEYCQGTRAPMQTALPAERFLWSTGAMPAVPDIEDGPNSNGRIQRGRASGGRSSKE